MKKWILHRLALLLLAALPFCSAQAELSVTAHNTGELAGTWGGKNWYNVNGHALWRQQDAAAIQVSCTAVLGCALAVGTVVGDKFYPRYGFIPVARGMAWEKAYTQWIYTHTTDMAFTYPEPAERLSAPGACSTVGLYWGREEGDGYSQWLPVPGSLCAPISGPQ
ncbi:hypothetical protein ACUTQ5_13740 [Serratia sp. NA_112.1]|uniref:hypothetical protein n=1 Tax=unclassified Serratia (in: enterobacteria) TaxID=2647522 RepID=UPI004046F08C